MKHMDTLTLDGASVAPILRDDRRRAIEPGMIAADLPVHRYGFATTRDSVITYVHLTHGSISAEVARAASLIEALGWRNTTVTNIDGVLAIETTF